VWTGALKEEHKHLQGNGIFSKDFDYSKNLFKKGSTIVLNNLPSVNTVTEIGKKVIDKGSEVLF
jgi:hypothetical protein